MYKLKNWSFGRFFDGGIYVNGIVFGHHRLQDGEDIHTSEIEKIYMYDENEYVVATHSGSLYHLLVDEMNPEKKENNKETLGTLKALKGVEKTEQLDTEIKRFEEKQKVVGLFMNTAKENMEDDGLYLIMEHMHVVKAVLKSNNVYRELHSSVHVGMFQDSVLVTDWEEGEVDFRFFPNLMMEPYHWSDGLNCIYIHNIGKNNILFKGTNQIIDCKTNEVTKICKNAYREEGLFSPDVVNGKCIFSNEIAGMKEKADVKEISQDEINKLLEGDIYGEISDL